MIIKLKSLILESQRTVELDSKLAALEADIRSKYPEIQSLVIHITPDEKLYVSALSIKPQFRRRGKGSDIMKELIKFAKDEKIPIILQAVPDKGKEEELKKFYDRLGFASNTGDTFDPDITPSDPITRYIKPPKKLTEENEQLQSISLITNIVKKDLAAAAQKRYDKWQQNEQGRSEELGYGGICHLIADDLIDVLQTHNIYNCQTVCSNYQQHVYVVGKFIEGVYMIDIPYYLYETGGGFTWHKTPNVVFDESYIDVIRLDADPENFKDYIDDF
jgi:hypothetical protein